jgi:signal peptidase I
MSPTLQGDEHSGDWVLAEKITYRFRKPRRWEVVEFTNYEGLQLMKRLAAFPGESLAIKDHQLQINGTPAAPPNPITYYPEGNLTAGKTFHVANGYYVLGDDSIDSQDSRYDGPVPPKKIRARALLILWPPSRIGFVH